MSQTKRKKHWLYAAVAVSVMSIGISMAAVTITRPRSETADASAPAASRLVSVRGSSATGKPAAAAGQPATSKTNPATTPNTARQAAATTAPTASPAVAAAPVPAALGLYAYPASSLASQATVWGASHPADAAAMARLAAQPVAQWFGDWNGNVSADVNAYVTAASNAGKLPVLVAYNIPNRDCNGASAGGASSDTAYLNWMTGFAGGIGQRRAIVLLEPDAVAATCYTSDRASLLSAAVQTLAATTRSSVYLDAGNPVWQPVGTMAARLRASGLAQATGFSLNVSNFQTTASNSAYGNQLSQATGGKHFVIDTSRNGNGPTADNQWCNPAGRAFGSAPTLATGQTVIDAYLWVKTPAESDGPCGPDELGTSAPAAGNWWPQYAISMAQASGWE